MTPLQEFFSSEIENDEYLASYAKQVNDGMSQHGLLRFELHGNVYDLLIDKEDETVTLQCVFDVDRRQSVSIEEFMAALQARKIQSLSR